MPGGIPPINDPNAIWSITPDDFKSVPDETLLEIRNFPSDDEVNTDDAGVHHLSTEEIWDT